MHTSLVSSESCNFEGLYAVTELNTASGLFLLPLFQKIKSFRSKLLLGESNQNYQLLNQKKREIFNASLLLL